MVSILGTLGRAEVSNNFSLSPFQRYSINLSVREVLYM